VAGGYYSERADAQCWDFCDLTAAELFDPSTGTFASAGSLSVSWRDLAIPLADGTVLFTGNGTAELYIPPASAVSTASLTAPVAAESLASLFGARFTSASAAADLRELPTTLGGVSLVVRDHGGAERLAPLLYVSPSQINFQMPAGAAEGDALVQIRDGAPALTLATAQVRRSAPGLFASAGNMASAYAVRLEADGRQTVLPPLEPVILDDRLVDLILFGTGIRYRTSLAGVTCTIGGIGVSVEYAGPGGGVPGLDQVNVRLTTDLKGNTDGRLVLSVDGLAANVVSVDIR
jgi:uncharacterized protein (TIGR03437 family)